MNAKRRVCLWGLGVMMAGVVGGCTSAEVSLTRMAPVFDGRRIVVVDVTEPQPQLKWTVGLAGELCYRSDRRMSECLEKAAAERGLFEVIDRSEFTRIIEERDLNVPARMDTHEAIKLARLAGMDAVVILNFQGGFAWNLIFFSEDYDAFVKLVDVRTGRHVWNSKGGYYYLTMFPFPLSRAVTRGAEVNNAEAMARELRRKLGARELARDKGA